MRYADDDAVVENYGRFVDWMLDLGFGLKITGCVVIVGGGILSGRVSVWMTFCATTKGLSQNHGFMEFIIKRRLVIITIEF